MGQAQTKIELQREVNSVFSNVCEPKCTVNQRSVYRNIDVEARGRCRATFGNISSCKLRASCDMDRAYTDLAVKMDQHPSVKTMLSKNNVNKSSKEIVKNMFEKNCSPEATVMQDLEAEDVTIKCFDDSVIEMMNDNVVEATCTTNVLDQLFTEEDLKQRDNTSEEPIKEGDGERKKEQTKKMVERFKVKMNLTNTQMVQLILSTSIMIIIFVLLLVLFFKKGNKKNEQGRTAA